MPVMPLDTETRTADLLTALADLGPGRSASPADLAIACGCSGSTARTPCCRASPPRGAVAECARRVRPALHAAAALSAGDATEPARRGSAATPRRQRALPQQRPDRGEVGGERAVLPHRRSTAATAARSAACQRRRQRPRRAGDGPGGRRRARRPGRARARRARGRAGPRRGRPSACTSSCPVEPSSWCTPGRGGEPAQLGDVAEHRLVGEDQPALAAGLGGELVGQARRSGVEQPVQPLQR